MHESDKKLKETKFVVEATSFEQQVLWERYSAESMYKTKHSVYNWEQINSGYMITVGHVNKWPVNISCNWAKINGVLVMFYCDVSRMVDHGMIKQWLADNCNPKHDDGRHSHVDAANFYAVIEFVNDNRK